MSVPSAIEGPRMKANGAPTIRMISISSRRAKSDRRTTAVTVNAAPSTSPPPPSNPPRAHRTRSSTNVLATGGRNEHQRRPRAQPGRSPGRQPRQLPWHPFEGAVRTRQETDCRRRCPRRRRAQGSRCGTVSLPDPSTRNQHRQQQGAPRVAMRQSRAWLRPRRRGGRPDISAADAT